MGEFIGKHPENGAGVPNRTKEMSSGVTPYLSPLEQLAIGGSFYRNGSFVNSERFFKEFERTHEIDPEYLVPDILRGAHTRQDVVRVNRIRHGIRLRDSVTFLSERTMLELKQRGVRPAIDPSPLNLSTGRARIFNELVMCDGFTGRKINAPRQLSNLLPLLEIDKPWNKLTDLTVTEDKKVYAVFDPERSQAA